MRLLIIRECGPAHLQRRFIIVTVSPGGDLRYSSLIDPTLKITYKQASRKLILDLCTFFVSIRFRDLSKINRVCSVSIEVATSIHNGHRLYLRRLGYLMAPLIR